MISNSPDVRGIDVALLYREEASLKFISFEEHFVPGPKATRNILEVKFELSCSRPLSVFVNHWPSQAATSPSRIFAAETLRKVIEARIEANPLTYIVSLGDYNVTLRDRPDPFYDVIQNPEWSLRLKDLGEEARSFLRNTDYKRFLTLPLGTYFYQSTMEWNEFDRAFFSSNLLNQEGFEVDLASYKIINPSFLTRTATYKEGSALFGTQIQNVPNRYNFKNVDEATQGFSDHFAISFEIKE